MRIRRFGTEERDGQAFLKAPAGVNDFPKDLFDGTGGQRPFVLDLETVQQRAFPSWHKDRAAVLLLQPPDQADEISPLVEKTQEGFVQLINTLAKLVKVHIIHPRFTMTETCLFSVSSRR